MAGETLPGILCIRADAHARMGIGHVMRCLALAQAWQDAGGKAIFVSTDPIPAISQRLELEQIQVLPQPHPPGSLEDARHTASLAHQTGARWLVVDGYHFSPEFRAELKHSRLHLLVIDDLADTDLSQADLILNQNAYAEPNLYAQAASHAVLLLGARYALLRREFTFHYTEKPDQAPQQALRVLIMMGGSDPANVTLPLMRLFTAPALHGLQLDIIAGAANPHLAVLRAALPDLQVHHDAELWVDPPDLPQRMAATHLAISAAGSSCWELAYFGLPMALVITAENQRGVAVSLEKLGVAEVLGESHDFPTKDTYARLQTLLADSQRRSEMSQRGRILIDGQGASRAGERLACYPISLRPVTLADAELLYHWANDPVTRQMSFSSDPIPWPHHLAWLERRTGSAGCRFSIALDATGEPIGQVRLEREGTIATLSLSLAATARGKGLAPKAARLAAIEAIQEKWCQTVHAWVKPENTASLQTFRRAGFQELGCQAEHSQQAALFIWPPSKNAAAII